MPFVIPKDSLNQFDKEGFLTIESFLSEANFELLRKSIIEALSQVPNGFMSRYLGGRDLFRSVEGVRKSLLKRDLQKMAGALTQELKLRFAFDQIWDGRHEQGKLFPDPVPLYEITSVDPLKLGALLCLEGESNHERFPKKPNEILFFNPNLPIPWQELPKGQMFLLFGFSPVNAIYKENLKDPNTHLLKRLDYQPNEPLHTKTHPVFKC